MVECLENWVNERKFNPKLEEYEHEDLDKKLQMFYAEVRIRVRTGVRWSTIKVRTG